MNPPSLSSLLTLITVQKLTAYLSVQGWKESSVEGRLIFDKEIEPGETQTISVLSDRTHPRFRSLLQNMMFALSVCEKREPADIAQEIAQFQTPKVREASNSVHQYHEIATHIRGLAQECVDSEKAKGKLLELARYLLIPMSRSIGMTPSIADALWDTARSDVSYFPAATAAWLESNSRDIPIERHG